MEETKLLGKLYINSYNTEMDGYDYKPQSIFNVTVIYENGIRFTTDISLPYLTSKYQDVYEMACTYFKGELILGN